MGIIFTFQAHSYSFSTYLLSNYHGPDTALDAEIIPALMAHVLRRRVQKANIQHQVTKRKIKQGAESDRKGCFRRGTQESLSEV